MLWHSGENLVQLTDLNLGSYQTVRSNIEDSMGMINYHLAINNDGDLAMVWQGQDSEGPNIFYRVYDVDYNSWSYDRQLTHDDALEKITKPVFNGEGSLLMAFNRAIIEFVSKNVEIDGNLVTFDEFPVQSQNDLYMLSYTPTEDLGFVEGGLSFVKEPLPGNQTTIIASVCNFGDMTKPEVNVAFYDGEPGNGGIPIGSIQSVPGGLDADDIYDFETDWTVPDDGQSHTIYALVDPESLIIESNEDNNSIHLTTLLPDIKFVSGQAQVAGDNQVNLIVSVSNNGTVPASNIVVNFYSDSIEGEFIGSRTIYTLAAGGQTEVLMPWASNGVELLLGNEIIVISIDQNAQIIEGDESNNQGTITTLFGRSADTSKAYVCKSGTSTKIPQYQSVQDALDAVVIPGTVMIQSESFQEDLEVNISGIVTITGGYDDNFENRDGVAVVSGIMTINSGTVEVDGLVIGGQ